MKRKFFCEVTFGTLVEAAISAVVQKRGRGRTMAGSVPRGGLPSCCCGQGRIENFHPGGGEAK